MYTVIVILHVLACLALILIVLLQTGRGAEMGAAFGGASQTLFGGGGGSTFLGKLTTGAAVVFMLTCLSLTYLSVGPTGKSVMEDVPVPVPQGPAVPDAKPVQPVPESARTPEASVKPPETVPAPQVNRMPLEEGAGTPQPTAPTQQESPAVEKGSDPDAGKGGGDGRGPAKRQDKGTPPVKKQ